MPQPLTIHLYALVWNERPLLPFFLEHYRPFVDRFFLADDGSDDGSFEYLSEQSDVTLTRFRYEGDSFVAAARDHYREAWKASAGVADFVIVVNIDELIHHPDPRKVFEEAREEGQTVMNARGWDMVSDTFPTHGPLTTTVPRGVHSRAMGKMVAFNPSAILDTGYDVGRHRAAPEGRIVHSRRPAFDLMHFKFLGHAYVQARYAALALRMRPGDIAAGYGKAYSEDPAILGARFQRLRQAARPVLMPARIAERRLSEPMPGVFVARLDATTNARGGLQEIWREDDPFAAPVRQTYVTTTTPGTVKAWYRHNAQTDQITPLSGAARLVLWKPLGPQLDTPPTIIELDARSPVLVVIPPGVWHGFQALGPDPLVLLHMNSAGFDWPATDEDRADPSQPGLPRPWLDPDAAAARR